MAPMTMMTFKKGDRVRLNREGCKIDSRPKAKNRLGVVAATPKEWCKWSTVAVLWDGLRIAQYWAAEYLEKVRVVKPKEDPDV